MYAYTYRVLNLELNFSISGEANFGFLFKTCQTVLLTLNFYIAHTHTFPNFNLKMGGGGGKGGGEDTKTRAISF